MSWPLLPLCEVYVLLVLKLRLMFLCPFWVGNHLAEEERDGCLIVFGLFCFVLCMFLFLLVTIGML